MLQWQYVNGAMGVKRLLAAGKGRLFATAHSSRFLWNVWKNPQKLRNLQKVTAFGYVFWVALSHRLHAALSYSGKPERTLLLSIALFFSSFWKAEPPFLRELGETSPGFLSLTFLRVRALHRAVYQCMAGNRSMAARGWSRGASGTCCVPMLTAWILCFVLGLRFIQT